MNNKKWSLLLTFLIPIFFITIGNAVENLSPEIKTNFKEAIQEGDLDTLKKIIQGNKEKGITKIILTGKFKNPFDLTLESPITSKEKLEIFQYLVNQGFDLSSMKQELLLKAYEKLIIEIVDYLATGLGKEKNAVIDEAIIKQAIANEALKHIFDLQKNGAQVEVSSKNVQILLQEGKIKDLKQFVANGAKISISDANVMTFLENRQDKELLEFINKGFAQFKPTIKHLEAAIKYSNNLDLIKWLVNQKTFNINQELPINPPAPLKDWPQGLSSIQPFCTVNQIYTLKTQTVVALAESLNKYDIIDFLKKSGGQSLKRTWQYKCVMGDQGDGWGSYYALVDYY